MPALIDHSPQQLAEIAHELRAPLGGLQAMIQVLGESELTPEQRETLDALAASAQHLRQIANRLLGERDPAGQPGPTRMMLRPFLNRIVRAAEARARVKGLTFAVLEARDLPTAADIDPVPLRQVLENLIDNAIRFTESGRIVLAVAKAGAGRISLRVSDCGPGVTSAEACRLIGEGGQIDGRAGGAGMGLAVAGRLVKERGGVLSGGPNCDGVGAVFSFDWPLLAEINDPACLIVDDHPASRAVLRTILQAAGHTCIEAESIEDAKALLAGLTPAHVLTDLHLGGANQGDAPNGADLVRWLAARKPEQRPRIVVVSADPVDSVPDLLPLVDAAIRKPLDVRSVLEAVQPARQQRKPAA